MRDPLCVSVLSLDVAIMVKPGSTVDASIAMTNTGTARRHRIFQDSTESVQEQKNKKPRV